MISRGRDARPHVFQCFFSIFINAQPRSPPNLKLRRISARLFCAFVKLLQRSFDDFWSQSSANQNLVADLASQSQHSRSLGCDANRNAAAQLRARPMEAVVSPPVNGFSLLQKFTNSDDIVACFLNRGRLETDIVNRAVALPIARTALPFEINSRLAIALAITEGSRVTGLVTRGPISTLSLFEAMSVKATKHSMLCHCVSPVPMRANP